MEFSWNQILTYNLYLRLTVAFLVQKEGEPALVSSFSQSKSWCYFLCLWYGLSSYLHKIKVFLIMQLAKIWANRGLVLSILLGFLLTKISALISKGGRGSEVDRSEFTDSLYSNFSMKAVVSDRAFRNFKRSPSYNLVLEHVSMEKGAGYLEYLQAHYPDLLANQNIMNLFINDKVGKPRRYFYPSVKTYMSPTTLRYVKVAADIKELFGVDLGRVAEIGGGYGGQLICLDEICDVDSYRIFDIYSVNHLIEKYVSFFNLRCTYRASHANDIMLNGTEEYDLVLSNYSFSELPMILQLKYLNIVMKKSKRGYVTLNSGFGGAFDRDQTKLNYQALKTCVSESLLLREVPSTGAHNYVWVWGVAASTLSKQFEIVDEQELQLLVGS